MARIKEVAKILRSDVHRPGIHAKTKTSSHKSSKNYQKKYRGQGR